MNKREYLLQKGLQIQQLSEDTGIKQLSTQTTISNSSKSSREVAKLRVLCPPGIDDTQILDLLQQTKGHAQYIEVAISELWENHRGERVVDDWAVVSKKSKKKMEPSPPTQNRHSRAPKQNPQNDSSSTTDTSSRTKSSNPGRGASKSGPNSGRGRGRDRDRSATSKPNGSHKNADENVKGDKTSTDPAESSTQKPHKSKSVKASKRRVQTSQTVNTAPPLVSPILKGAWVKKPNLGGISAQPSLEQVSAEVSSAKMDASPPPAASLSPPVVTTHEPVESDEISLNESPQMQMSSGTSESYPSSGIIASSMDDKLTSPKVEEMDNSAIASAWGTLDVSGTNMAGWATNPTESATVAANTWVCGPQILNTVQSTSEGTSSMPTVIPGSPKDDQVLRSETSAPSTSPSPKQYLKMGKWDSAAASSISLQFGSFSLGGSGHSETSASPRWGSTPNSSQPSGPANPSEAQWGSQSSVSPKQKSVLKRPLESDHIVSAAQVHSSSHEEDATIRKTGSSGVSSVPPGLSVQADRHSPKSSHSPPSFPPSAPSPATLPKPEDVKRGTPTHQQSQFQGQPTPKLSIGSSSSYNAEFSSKAGLYQSPYGQYSMDLVGTRSNPNPAGMAPTQIITQKPNTSRTVSTGSNHSPTHGHPQSQNAQLQHLQRHIQQSQQSQQCKPQPLLQHQGPPGQAAPQNHTYSQSHQQAMAAHFQSNQPGPQGYHPHYGPPPPPGMAVPYQPYNYPGYYQNYGYYQNPQYHQFSPRSQYPSRGNIPYNVEGPVPGFSNAGGPPVSYQDQHVMAHQHEYANVAQGFGEINGIYSQQSSQPQHVHQQNASQTHGKGAGSGISAGSQRSALSSYQTVTNSGSRDVPPAPNASGAVSSGPYAGGQHYVWQSYNGQPVTGWNHMAPQGYQQTPGMHQQHSALHPQQSYRQYASNASNGNNATENNVSSGGHGHSQSSWNP
uniref:Uncharacterized protein AlNc14C95G5836 n=1 Tax=Albugo laibachii Nc14 TaxID=890382 RepID=F0WGW0_9STRA|nr:conserved hypothetical protein [Albugo laibachii Nc14]|eukprot:CCA20475.1 conserved hypothetical protein [Albugo laibachii Nc14]